DTDELIAFLKEMTRETGVREGRRAMYDLCDLAKKAFFHPATKGSSSLKKVLPAVMASSDYLRERYGRPVYGSQGGIVSKNFKDWQWWQAAGEAPLNPYELLPPVFDDLPRELLDGLDA